MWSLGNFFQKIINVYTPLLGELEYVCKNDKACTCMIIASTENTQYALISDFYPLFCLPTSANTFYSFSNDKLFKRRQYKCARFLENVGRVSIYELLDAFAKKYCTINLITYLLFNCSPYDIIGSHHLLDFICFSEQTRAL